MAEVEKREIRRYYDKGRGQNKRWSDDVVSVTVATETPRDYDGVLLAVRTLIWDLAQSDPPIREIERGAIGINMSDDGLRVFASFVQRDIPEVAYPDTYETRSFWPHQESTALTSTGASAEA